MANFEPFDDHHDGFSKKNLEEQLHFKNFKTESGRSCYQYVITILKIRLKLLYHIFYIYFEITTIIDRLSYVTTSGTFSSYQLEHRRVTFTFSSDLDS